MRLGFNGGVGLYLHAPRRLPDLEEDFSNIWAKTAAILKFGADYFQALREPRNACFEVDSLAPRRRRRAKRASPTGVACASC